MSISDSPGGDIPTEEGDFVNEKIESLIDDLPGNGSEGFVRPEDCEGGEDAVRNSFGEIIESLWNGDDDGMASEAENLNYDLVLYTDTEGGDAEYYLLTEQTDDPTGQGIFVLNPGGARNLVIEAPHPIYDTDSDLVAAQIFRDTGAKALLIAGTHRCADDEESECSGTTDVCGAEGPYRISDPAHFTCNFFQAAHEALSDHSEDPVILQIHGFSQTEGEPDAILSDGVEHTAENSDNVLALAINLKERLDATGDDDGVSACQADDPDADGDGIAVDSSFLCAFVNVQGRYTNGSTEDACTEEATNSSDRFIHVELSFDLRRDDGGESDAGPEDLVEAIIETF